MKLLTSLAFGLFAAAGVAVARDNSTFLNPVLPGWHSDPSCTRVDDTFYCITSSFIAFPGLPIYASTDLLNWRLVTHVWNRESQIPGESWQTLGQQEGMYAATLRHHKGEFWVACEYLRDNRAGGSIAGVLFRSKDIYDDKAWSDAVYFYPEGIDPDLFWDDDDTLWVATHGVRLQSLNPVTGELSRPPLNIWPGTGGVWPEGPHIYKRDGWYYLLIAEGGTAEDHSVTIARARNVTGPYESYENNPILTNKGTDNYFQTVGHADLFTDVDGNWWGLALATRCGPDCKYYPMGRESVLFAATWNEGEWPVLQPVSGNNTAWPLPTPNPDVPGDGPLNDAADEYAFDVAGAPLPKHFLHWRVPREGVFTTTDDGLEIAPSRNNLTGIPRSEEDVNLTGRRGLSFVGRRQSHSVFDFSVDIDFAPKAVGQEAGITVFLTQVNHIDVSVVLVDGEDDEPILAFRSRAEGTTKPPAPLLVPVPRCWKSPYTLHIQAEDPTSYTLSASYGSSKPLQLGTASSTLVSGGNGSFVGSLLGAFSTCNGAGEGADCPEGPSPKFLNWKYTPIAQYITEDDWVEV